MNWHETIEQIRQDPQYADLVRLAYFDADLRLNVERFGASEEFVETLKLIEQYAPSAKSVLDIGAGNGISSVNFALKGYTVTAVEPDPSNSVGANAIRSLQQSFGLSQLSVCQQYAEEIGFEENSFDIVYVRQAMHHALELNKFIAECARVLKPGGILLTIRDHIILDAKDKAWFLEAHPLHKFYGGENAFTVNEYKQAMRVAGLRIEKELKFYDSTINYFPLSVKEFQLMESSRAQYLQSELKRKLGPLSGISIISSWYKKKNSFDGALLNENEVPGRMYSYVCKKV
jgi:ubiquinone/menaquinone biosynthesis C-methylase UbiE